MSVDSASTSISCSNAALATYFAARSRSGHRGLMPKIDQGAIERLDDPAAAARRAAPDRRAGRGAALGDRRAPRRDRAGPAPLRVAPPRGARARVPRRARPAGPVRRARVRPARAHPRRAGRGRRGHWPTSAPACDHAEVVTSRRHPGHALHGAALHRRRGCALPRCARHRRSRRGRRATSVGRPAGLRLRERRS